MIEPCPICGYDRPRALDGASACLHCADRPAEPSLRERSGTWSGVRAGLAALPRGLAALVTTRGTKRWLVPPALIVLAAFVAATWGLWKIVVALIERLESGASELAGGGDSWWRTVVEWLLAKSVLFVLAQLSGAVLVIAVGLVAMVWTFSLVYELVAGPFLDTIQGRLEQRWFGADLRDRRERPAGISPAEAARITVAASVIAVCCVVASLFVEGALAKWIGAAAAASVFGLFAWRQRAWGTWLRWRIGIELRTLLVSVEASLLSAFLLAFALPLLLVPVAGYPLFALAAGFTTAISLLDIPMSRRRWEFSTRVSFVLHHAPAVLAFGVCASLVFVVPVLGSLVMVPAASAGGAWLLCRLDKSALRSQRFESDRVQ